MLRPQIIPKLCASVVDYLKYNKTTDPDCYSAKAVVDERMIAKG